MRKGEEPPPRKRERRGSANGAASLIVVENRILAYVPFAAFVVNKGPRARSKGGRGVRGGPSKASKTHFLVEC